MNNEILSLWWVDKGPAQARRVGKPLLSDGNRKVGLPSSFDPGNANIDTSELAAAFIRSTYAPPTHAPHMEHQFRQALAGLAPCFKATLRDIQTVMFLRQLFRREVLNDRKRTANPS